MYTLKAKVSQKYEGEKSQTEKGANKLLWGGHTGRISRQFSQGYLGLTHLFTDWSPLCLLLFLLLSDLFIQFYACIWSSTA